MSSLNARSSARKSKNQGESRWDRLGVWASVACAIHCLVAPFLFLAVPTFASLWAHPSSHALIAVLVLPLAGTVLIQGYRLHRKRWVAVAAGLGAACILVGSALPFLEALPSLEGSGAVVAASTGCADCCPQLVQNEAGDWSLGWPRHRS